MLVRDQDRGQCFTSRTGGGQALESLLARKPGIDQQARALGGNQGGVAGTGGRKYREFDYWGASSLLKAERRERASTFCQQTSQRGDPGDKRDLRSRESIKSSKVG
jgi:hypothetical protein